MSNNLRGLGYMRTRIMAKSIYGGEFLCKNTNDALDFLKDLSDKTFE